MDEQKEASQYKMLYDKYTDYVRTTHERNQQKIKSGLKVNILLPLVFLAISFITKTSKLFFLIMWILSLFGIAIYLVYIEYMDFKMQQLLDSFEEGDEPEALIGSDFIKLESSVKGKIEKIDSHIANVKKATKEKITGRNKKQEAEENTEEEDA